MLKHATYFTSVIFALFFFSFATADDKSWQSIETEHFVLHFQPPYLTWAQTTALQLEEIRDAVLTDQNRALTEKVEVIIFDPLNDANGSAVPISHKPFMRLYTTPPTSDSLIGNLTDWRQVLALHEYIHLVHLGQKSRNNTDRTISQLWDVYDILSYPGSRWVSEGYATLKESRMTGRGRLYSVLAESFVRQIARDGNFPSYHQLDNGSGKYKQRALAYLIGSRFLLWLEEHYGPESIDAIWTRWRAVYDRSFEEAFKGVFLEAPEKLYGKFSSEYIHKTLASDQLVESNDHSELWQPLGYGAAYLSVSPNKSLVAVIEYNNEDESFLNIYSTEDNKKAKSEFEKISKEILNDDPSDIMGKAPETFGHKKVHSLNQHNYRGFDNPVWMNDETLLFISKSKDSSGNLRNDLFQWHLPSDSVKQLSKHLNLRRFDLHRQTNTIIAEQNIYGRSSLVAFSLLTKQLTPLSTSTIETLYDIPSISNDGKYLAYMEHNSNGHWQLKYREIIVTDNTPQLSTKIQTIPTPNGSEFISYPSWNKDNKTINYIINKQWQTVLAQTNIETLKSRVITESLPLLSWPVELTDNRYLLLTENSYGKNIRLVDQSCVESQACSEKVANNSVKLATPMTFPKENKLPLIKKVTDIQQEDIDSLKPKAYGVGKRNHTFTFATSFNSASFDIFEMGIKSDDLLEHLVWQLNASFDFDGAISGYNGHLQWEQWPIKFAAHHSNYTLDPQNFDDPQVLDEVAISQTSLRAFWDYGYEEFNAQIGAQYLSGSWDNVDTSESRFYIKESWRTDHQSWRFKQAIQYQGLQGKFGEDDWDGFDLQADVHFKLWGQTLNLTSSIKERDNLDANTSLLTLGGYASTLISNETNSQMIFEPALPFFTASGNKYRSNVIETPLSNSGLQLFYREHKFDQQAVYRVNGIEFAHPINLGVTGLNDIFLNAGFAKTRHKGDEDNTQIWAGFSYQW